MIKLIPQSVQILTSKEELENGVKRIETMGRICWQSEPKYEDSTIPFVKMLIGRHHESVLEHATLSVILETDRATANQLVRHRLCSFSQESQRYCCYTNAKFASCLTVIKPQNWDTVSNEYHEKFESVCDNAFLAYQEALMQKVKPEEARRLLPNATKTQIGVTANIREWRHVFKERLCSAAEPQTRALIFGVYNWLKDNGFEYLIEDIETSDKGINEYPVIK
jgi:thymidylate synthase (FAD)